MAALNQVSFTSPGNPYAHDIYELQRRQRLAEALDQQSMQPLDTNRMAGRFVVPVSPLEGLNKAAQGVAAGIEQQRIRQGMKDLDRRYQDDLAKALTEAQRVGNPRQEAVNTAQEGTSSFDMSGSAGPAQQTVPGDRQAMIRALMGHPATQPLAIQQMQRDMQMQAFMASGGLNPGAATPPPPGGGSVPMAENGQPAFPAAPSPNGVPGFGGRAGGTPMSAWLSADPTGKSYLEQLAKDNAPIIQREGGVYERGPNGIQMLIAPKTNLAQGVQPTQFGPKGEVMRAQAVPGYAGAVGQISGAEEAAKSPYRFREVPAGGGSTRVVRESEIPGAPPVPGQPLPLKGANGRPLEPIAGKVPPEDLPAFNAVNSGQTPSALGRSQTTAEKTWDQERAKGYVKLAEDMRSTWSSAQSQRQMLDRLEQLFADPNVAKGALAENISGLKNIATSLGVDIKGLPAEQAIQSISNEFALQLRNPAGGAGMPGAMSDSDRKFLASIPPSLGKTPQGRAMIMDTMRKKLQRDQEVANMAIEYELKHGKIDANFEKELRQFSNANPIFGQTPEKPKLSPAAVQFLKQNGINVE